MSWKNLDPHEKNNVYIITLSGILIVLFYLICNNLSSIGSVLGSIGNTLMPFFFGILIAVILLPLRRVIENKWLKSYHGKHFSRRALSVTITMTIMIALIILFFAIVIPQLVDSIGTLITNFDGYMDSLSGWINKISKNYPELGSSLNTGIQDIADKIYDWLTGAKGGLTTILEYSISVIRNVLNFLIGIILAVYLLLQEEFFKRQGRRIVYAVCSEKAGDFIMRLARLTYRMFNKFISGKALDSLIIGIVAWIVPTLLGMPYAPLIGFIVGVTNMIPVFGPFIGAVPCVIILLIIKPVMALEFTIFIIILQQIDGNILGPYILGDTMGLPTFWIMFAIIVGGSLFGVAGMFLGVPVFAVIYSVLKELIDESLKKKKIDVEEK